MKVGILVDGEAEYKSFPLFIPRIDTPLTILNPLYCDIQPSSPPRQIAHVAVKRSGILVERGASVILMLIDKENSTSCAPEFCNQIESAFIQQLASSYPRVIGKVVVKNTCFENWLVSDPDAFQVLTGMFENINRIRAAVTPNKADNVDAMGLLNRCCKRGYFEKVKGSIAICSRFAPERAAQNSRSFRRFLRIVNHPTYLAQSKHP